MRRLSWAMGHGPWAGRRSLGFVLAALCLYGTSAAADDVGVLVLAHGGSAAWNRTVKETVAAAELDYPTEVVFGMGMHAHEVAELRRAVDRLQRRGIDRLVVVPLLISSTSEVMRQFHYLLGLRPQGSWNEMKPVRVEVPIVMGQALDDDPVVSEILLERARVLSRQPAQENVVLLAHGPTSDEDNAHWLATMDRLANRMQTQGRFRRVVTATMRDDAPAAVREAATRQLRMVIQHAREEGRVLVVPLLLANGGVESKIPQRLRGLDYVCGNQALLPHPKLSQWIARQVQAALATSPQTLIPSRQPHGVVASSSGASEPVVLQ